MCIRDRSCYGTNRLNEEMKAAINELKHLKEIVFAFDNDEAGNKAVEKYTEELLSLIHIFERYQRQNRCDATECFAGVAKHERSDSGGKRQTTGGDGAD